MKRVRLGNMAAARRGLRLEGGAARWHRCHFEDCSQWHHLGCKVSRMSLNRQIGDEANHRLTFLYNNKDPVISEIQKASCRFWSDRI